MAKANPSPSRKPAPPRANPIPARAATEDEIYALTCHLQRSIRYHRARERFFQGWTNAISFLSLLGGSSVVVSILASAPNWLAFAAGAVVALTQAGEQIGPFALKATG